MNESESYIYGLLITDGSLYLSTRNRGPFISLVTKSENLKNEYLNFLFIELGITKNINRNNRDNIYNIYLSGNNAIKLAKILYIDNPGIYLDRKYNKALEIQNNFN